jgi:WD repeat-containing protein 70
MLEDDEIPEPKPLVSYAILPEDEEEPYVPDILDKIEATTKIPVDFGRNRNIINADIKEKIHELHKVKEPEKCFVPYDVDMEEKDLIGPPIPKNFTIQSEDGLQDEQINNKSESEGNESEEEDLSKTIPITHVVDLIHSENKSINSLDIDRAGNRLITGSYDGTVKIWDFTSMTRRPSAFHTVDAGMDYPVVSVSWAPSGGFFLAATGDCQAKVYDRDGNFEIGCLKGDNYLHDIGNTKGHTYPLTDGKWHPLERNLFITSGRDSTVRIWDIYSKPMGIDQELMQTTILKAKTTKNHKIPVNCCLYSPDGKLILAGVNDGSLQMWSNKSNNYWKPDIYIPDAHTSNSEITSILFSEDSYKFYSRAEDNTMKMWDIRRYKKPMNVWRDLPCFSSKTGMALSPDENMIMTGTSVKKGHENSSIMFFSTLDYEKIKDLNICRNSITSMVWNAKLNQIALGATDGICRMYFNPELSKNGIVNSIYKKAKIKEVDDFEYAKPIITPLVLPLFDETNFNRNTYMEKIQDNLGPSPKAELPVQGPGSKFARPPSVTQHIMTNLHKKIYDEGDAREILLKFADKPGEWVDSAYKKTQPKPIFDYSGPHEDEVKYYEQTKRKICHGCGLKFCICKKSIFQLPVPKSTNQHK